MCFRQFRQRAINMRGSSIPQHQLCFLLFFYDVILWPKHPGHDVISGLQIRQNFLKILIGSWVVPVSRCNRYAVYYHHSQWQLLRLRFICVKHTNWSLWILSDYRLSIWYRHYCCCAFRSHSPFRLCYRYDIEMTDYTDYCILLLPQIRI